MKITSMADKNRLKVLIIPDIHFPEQDNRALEILFHVLKTDKFDEVIQLGDMLDMYPISSFSKDPEKVGLGLRNEIVMARTFLEKVRKLQPKAKITLLKGNHEARFDRYVIDKAPGLAHLFDYRDLLGLKELKMKYVESIYNIGKLHFMHGVLVRAHSAYSCKSHFDKYNMSIVHGHTHRLGSYYKTNLDTTFTVQEMGCLCALNPDYTKDKGVTDWQQGFGVAYIDKKSGWFFIVPFPIVNHTCIYKDKVIRA